jgi:hypothetical protein
MLTDATRFGHMVHIYHGGYVLTVADDRRSSASRYEVAGAGPGTLSIRYFDGFGLEQRDLTLTLDEDRLYVPMLLLGRKAREVFTRVAIEDVMQRHPCTRAFVQGMRPTLLRSFMLHA